MIASRQPAELFVNNMTLSEALVFSINLIVVA